MYNYRDTGNTGIRDRYADASLRSHGIDSAMTAAAGNRTISNNTNSNSNTGGSYGGSSGQNMNPRYPGPGGYHVAQRDIPSNNNPYRIEPGYRPGVHRDVRDSGLSQIALERPIAGNDDLRHQLINQLLPGHPTGTMTMSTGNPGDMTSTGKKLLYCEYCKLTYQEERVSIYAP